MNMEGNLQGAKAGPLARKALAVFMSAVLAFGMSPIGHAPIAYASEGDAPQQDQQQGQQGDGQDQQQDQDQQGDGHNQQGQDRQGQDQQGQDQQGQQEQDEETGIGAPVAAPLDDHSSNATEVNALLAEAGFGLTNVSYKADTKTYSFDLSTTALVKHTNLGSMRAYWVGFGIPQAPEGKTYAYYTGYGAFDAEQLGEAKTPSFEGWEDANGTKRDTFYFGAATADKPISELQKGVWLAVKSGEDIVAVYQADTKNVKAKEYDVTAKAAEGGSVGLSSAKAAEGETVTAMPKQADAVHYLASIEASGGAQLVAGEGGAYTFTMPGSAVEVTPTFAEAQAVTAAPLADHGEDGKTETPLENTGFALKGKSVSLDGKAYTVALESTALPQHYSLATDEDGKHLKKYWFGIGIPVGTGTGLGDVTAASGFDAVPTDFKDVEFSDSRTSWYKDGDQVYSTFYFNTSASYRSATDAWVALKDKDGAITTYQIDTSALKFDSAVSVADGIANGSVSVEGDPTHAAEGTTVTVKPAPDKGYVVDAVSYKATGAEEATAIEPVEGAYSFAMPGSDVEVTATFAEQQGGAYQPVAAPIVNHDIDETTKADTETDITAATGYKLKSQTYDPETRTYTVALESDGLTKHNNSGGVAAFWFGIGVPLGDADGLVGYKAVTGYGEVPEASQLDFESSSKERTSYFVDKDTEQGYSTFYFGAKYPDSPASYRAEKGAYLVLQNEKTKQLTTYVLDTSAMKFAYDASVADGIKGGTVTLSGADNATVTAGEKVALNVEPKTANGYVTESVSIAYKNSEGTQVTDKVEPVDGAYSFTMPESDVEVSAVFKGDLDKAVITLEGDGTVAFDPAGDGVDPVKSALFGFEDMTKDKDYTVACKDLLGEEVETLEDAGNYKVTVTGIGSYTGERTFDFTIEPYALDENAAKVVVAADPATASWTGDDIPVNVTAKVEVKAAAEGAEAEYAVLGPEDFTSIPGTVSGVGSYDVTVIGKNNYTGRVKAEAAFRVVAVDLKDAELTATATYTGEPIDAACELKSGDDVIDAANYTLAYSVEDGDTGTLEGGKPLTAGTYHVTASAVEGSELYTGSKTAELTVAPYDLSKDAELDEPLVEIAVAPAPYTGEEQESAAPTVTFNGKALGADDYTATPAKGTDAGKYDVEVEGAGNFTGKATGTFEITPVSLSDVAVLGDIEHGTYSGAENKPASVPVQLKDPAAKYVLAGGYDVAYSVAGAEQPAADEDADEDADGSDEPGSGEAPEVSVVDAGDYVVTVTGKGNYAGELTGTYTIDPLAISSDSVTVEPFTSETYDGAPHSPELTVKFNGKALALDDYSYTFGEGAKVVDAGDYTATITGAGNFTGETTAKFTVEPLAIEQGMVKFWNGARWVDEYSTADADDQPKAGIAVGDEVVAEGIAVSYVGNKAVVKADSKNFSGQAVKAWNVASLSIEDGGTVELSAEKATFTGEDLTPDVTVRVDGVGTLVGDSIDYSVAFYGEDGEPVGSDGIVDAGTYSVVVSGTGNFGGQLSGKTFTVEKQDISDEGNVTVGEIAEQTYTGSAIVPVPSVTFEGEELEKDEDFVVAYEDNVEPGKATATVAGIGNFKGSVDVPFTIAKDASLNSTNYKIIGADDAALGPYPYTGEQVKPEIKIVSTTDSKKEFAGTTFTPVYTSNINVGTAKVTVFATGNYTGSVSAEFKISALDIADAQIDFGKVAYDGGKALEPVPAVTYKDEAGHEIELAKDVDYGISYEGNANAGEAMAILVGAGNFEGYQAASFRIDKKQIDAPAPAKGLKYTGAEQVGVAAGEGYALSGDAAATNAGPYAATATLSDPANTEWADGTTEPKGIEWEIAKAAQTITLGKKAKTGTYAYGATLEMGAKVTAGDGAVRYSSTKPSVASVDKNGKVTVKAGSGTAKITATAGETDNYAEATKSITVTAKKAANPLALQNATASGTNKAKRTYNLAKNAKKSGGILAKAGQGTVTYAKVKVTNKNGKAVSKALANKFKVSGGKLTVDKNTAKGTYKVTVRATTNGNANYAATKKGGLTAVVTVTVK